MQTAQSLSIPFQEFATFAALPQEGLPQEPLQTPILEENLLNICKSEENSLPLRKFFLDTLYFRYNNMEVQIKDNKIFAPLKDKWLVNKPEEQVRQQFKNKLLMLWVEQECQEYQKKHFEAFKFRLPPLNIQNEIVEHIDVLRKEQKDLQQKALTLRQQATKQFEQTIFN